MNKKQKKEYDERKIFVDKYSRFTIWLYDLGFRSAYFGERGRPLDYFYEIYHDYIDHLTGIEYFIFDDLGIHLRFIRDRDEHKVMFIQYSMDFKCVPLEDAKEFILNKVKMRKDELLQKLLPIKV